jgi:hypothetical protein
VVRADVKPSQQTFRNEPGVFVNESNGADAHQHHEDAFKELQCGYGPQDAPLIAMGISRLSVLAHER